MQDNDNAVNDELTVQKSVHELAAPTPQDLLQMAVQTGADIEKLEKLMGLQERWEAGEARKSFMRAMAGFQKSVPSIRKHKQVAFGQTSYSYAPLSDIAEQIRGCMEQFGLSYRFDIKDADDKIEVSCICSHIDGHFEKTSMSSKADDSGKKNAIQSRGSAISYLQRYTLIAILGLTTADEDIDGRLQKDSEIITESQLEELKVLVKEVMVKDIKKFLSIYKVTDLHFLPQSQFTRAKTALLRKKAWLEDKAKEKEESNVTG